MGRLNVFISIFYRKISKTLKYIHGGNDVLDFLYSTEKGTMAKDIDEAGLVVDRWSWVMGTQDNSTLFYFCSNFSIIRTVLKVCVYLVLP